MTESITISRRFQGPPNSGNGGYVCGCLASFIDGPATVRLKRPPRLETELNVRRNTKGFELLDGEQVVAEAWRADLSIEPPSPPSFAESVSASKDYRGHRSHPFPAVLSADLIDPSRTVFASFRDRYRIVLWSPPPGGRRHLWRTYRELFKRNFCGPPWTAPAPSPLNGRKGKWCFWES